MTFKAVNSKFHLTHSSYQALTLDKYLKHTRFEPGFRLQYKNYPFRQQKLAGHLSVPDSHTHPVSDSHLLQHLLQAG